MSKRSRWFHLPRLAAGATGRSELLVALDVDAPVGAAARAQHAGRAVVLVQRDHATSTDRRGFLLVRVLHGVRAVLDGAAERAGRDAEAFDQAGNLGLGHQIATFRIAVTAMLASEMGMRNFQAKVCSWSSRKRG